MGTLILGRFQRPARHHGLRTFWHWPEWPRKISAWWSRLVCVCVWGGVEDCSSWYELVWYFVWRSTTICVISTLGLIWTTCNRRPTQALALWWSGQRNLFLTHRCVEQKLKKKKIPSIEHRHPLDRFLASYIDKVEKGDEAWARKDFGNLNWTQFVDRMLETRPDTWNEHWAPIHHLCPPCIRWIRWTRWIPQSIVYAQWHCPPCIREELKVLPPWKFIGRYDVVARMETFSADSEYIINR